MSAVKVVAFNASPHPQGNTAHALRIVTDVLERNGIETETIHIGGQDIHPCMGCNGCARSRDGRCVLPDDGLNGWIEKIRQADGLLLGTPVHFSGMSGAMKCFLDRMTYVCGNSGGLLRHKVGAAVAAVRRYGGIPAVDGVNHYLTYSEMLLPASNYWNVIHGLRPGEVEGDEEGVQILQVLGENMAWLLKLVDYGRDAVPAPQPVRKKFTNFIR